MSASVLSLRRSGRAGNHAAQPFGGTHSRSWSGPKSAQPHRSGATEKADSRLPTHVGRPANSLNELMTIAAGSYHNLASEPSRQYRALSKRNSLRHQPIHSCIGDGDQDISGPQHR